MDFDVILNAARNERTHAWGNEESPGVSNDVSRRGDSSVASSLRMTSRWSSLLIVALFLFTLATNSVAAINPHVQEFTSTRSVTSMVVTKDRTLWVGTRGGILTRDAAGKWTKQTMQNGLPSNEVRHVSVSQDDTIEVLFPNADSVWKEGKWHTHKSTYVAPKQYEFPKTQWQHKTVQATWNGLQVEDQQIEMPDSKGSYISALLPQGKVLMVAIYGDGIWSYDGSKWQKLYAALPKEAQQITALAIDSAARVLFVGTRRDGVWMFDGKHWQQHLQDNEPYNDNIQNLISFQGNLYASTLEDGLLEYANGKWRHFDNAILSSNAPRQMAVFRKNLYVRFGNGMVDRFDGTHWQRNVFPDLPRGKVYSLAADERKVYLGQWGGWSEWDGKSFQHFLKIPELQGVPLLVLHPIGYSLWIGTQSLGLARFYDYEALPFYGIPGSFNPSTEDSFQIFDARHGLSDDWITAIAGTSDGNIFAGTFVGGLVKRAMLGWETQTPVSGENVTALEMDGKGGVFIATRHGVWHKDQADIWRNYQQYFPALSPEAQALLNTSDGLWIGTRTGLFFTPHLESSG